MMHRKFLIIFLLILFLCFAKGTVSEYAQELYEFDSNDDDPHVIILNIFPE